MVRNFQTPTRIVAAAIFASWGAVAAAAFLGLPSETEAAPPRPIADSQRPQDTKSLRICAAKNQPPLSLEDGSGLENKIGVALAEAMDLKPQYVWSDRPAIYLVRDYLDKKLCDVVIGLDTGDTRVVTSSPYYRSGYVFITRADRDLDIEFWADPRVARLGHVAVTFRLAGRGSPEGQGSL